MSVTSQPYRIVLPQFEGPFDLLLFFIERDELDICNIPIAKITDDFLQYIQDAKALDISLAGEFLVVAATLLSIKARVLLPRLPKNEEGEDIDPRQELVDRLLEYKRYKEVISELQRMEEERGQMFARPFVAERFYELLDEAQSEAEWESLTLYKLYAAFQRVLERQKERETQHSVHKVVRWPYTVEEESERIQQQLRLRGKVAFVSLFGVCRNRVHAVVTFLALLEMLNAGLLSIEPLSNAYNDFVITEAQPIVIDESERAEPEESEESEIQAESPVEKVLANLN